MDRETARKIYIMLDSGLIWYKHYYLWCDSIIEKLEVPPIWIIDLSTAKYIGDAKEIVSEYAFSFDETVYVFDLMKHNRHFLACLYLRYERKEISWATFLNEAGKYSDSYDCGVDCEYFFEMLTNYGDSLYSPNLEKSQSIEVESLIRDSITNISKLYNEFHKYFIRFVEKCNKF